MNEYDNWEIYLEHCLADTQNLRLNRNLNYDRLERFMKIAWNTEYVLTLGSEDIELMRVNNQWSPIQAYYAIYASAEACGQAIDGRISNSHKGALRGITDYFRRHNVKPWNYAFKGYRGRLKNEHFPVNFPDDITFPSNLQRRNVNPIQMIATCLRAEHNNRIEKYKKTASTQPFKHSYDPGYTSLIHFLYRLRIKSNYKNVEIFITDASEEYISDFYYGLKDICFYLLTYMEVILFRKCDKDRIISIGSSFQERLGSSAPISHRLEFYKDFFS